ncbi:MAG: FliO/MopB family protein [Alphaproteobacteria bacterium]
MDPTTLLRFALALLFVIGLIAGLSWLLRRYGMGGSIVTGGRGRIGVVEMAPIDAKRRLVLVRRDDIEHLVVLSPTRETVLETGIAPAKPTMERNPSPPHEPSRRQA